MTHHNNRSVTDSLPDRPPIGSDPSGHRSHGRTDGLTKKNSPSESVSPNASPANSHTIPPISNPARYDHSSLEALDHPHRARAAQIVHHAREVIAQLEYDGPGIVPHLLDTDDNAGQRLREALGTNDQSATDVRPVVPVVARALDDPASVVNPLVDGEELNEPLTVAEVREIEQFTWEFSDAAGNTTLAGDDLIRLCRQALRDSRELALTDGDLAVAVREALDAHALVAGQTKTIGVLGTAVGKVAALHVDDGEGYCKACQTSPHPCATAVAIGSGQ